ncbi:ABC transporter substrate-binding protein [Pseudanabaena sp. FACHB-1998]|uniref:ABC transporter substrate-binding protein n=1 Tax=Pseudanabaena sp. FACHB-1998 TaxID=2692858 RepID=UPI001681B4A6|nr:ABC transporter substrate-binding protein [Pseudanabaena sp. FACHB-1998]MBD2178288.1 ABC transporter substrate-binding protein [Pseudanabaena sp. FACHB-1998]
MRIRRRNFLQIVGGTTGAILTNTWSSNAQGKNPKIVIGYPAVTPALPLYLALEKGYFKQMGLEVEAVAFANPQEVVEGIIAGKIQAAGNGVSSGNLAIGEDKSAGNFKIICSNSSNTKFILEQFVVAKNSEIKQISELNGKKVCSGLGPQNIALAKAILAKNGYPNAQILPLSFDKHIAALESGEVDAAYTLEPIGTVGRSEGKTRTLEAGVVSKYILGDPLAPWFGGSAAVSTKFLKEYPAIAQKFIAAYRRGVMEVRRNPILSRQYLQRYTKIKPSLTSRVPLPDYRMFDEFSPQDVAYFQNFFDFLTSEKVLSRKIDVSPLIFT